MKRPQATVSPWDAACRLLAYRARSVEEMRGRLRDKDYAAEEIEQTLGRLLELRLLDDAAFALELASSLGRRGNGPGKMRSRLARSGVSAAHAKGAIEHTLEEAGGETALAKAALADRGKGHGPEDRPGPDDRRKAAAWLVRRGFSTDVAGEITGVFADSGLDGLD